MAQIETNLGRLRRKRGISAIHLAAAAGISRQTVHAIEAGIYVPNTVVALHLARALETTVEELFALPASVRARSEQSTLLAGSETPRAGQPVQLCRVGKRLIAEPPSRLTWHFPAADAVIAGQPDTDGRTRVQILQPDTDFSNRILIAGCDPGISVLARHIQPGAELVLAHRNSSQALALLKSGVVHVAGTHLKDNLPAVERLFPKNSVAVISFAAWEEGILTHSGNPKEIRGIEDLARKDVSIANREEGSGSRALLDSKLKDAGIAPKSVRGYTQMASGHLSAAFQVQSGAVDCCIATGAAARIFGLHFIPLLTEKYDLVIRRQHLDLPHVQNMLDTLTLGRVRGELEALGGYDTSVTGQRVA